MTFYRGIHHFQIFLCSVTLRSLESTRSLNGSSGLDIVHPAVLDKSLWQNIRRNSDNRPRIDETDQKVP